MILGKCWLTQGDTKDKTNGTRVFWDTFWGRGNMDNPGSAHSMRSRDTISDMEVLATLSGVQYQESQRSFYLEVLKSDTSSHLLSNVPQYIKDQDANPIGLHWLQAHQDFP